MQKFLNLLLNRKISTQRVDNMPSNLAVSALDRRVNQMLALHATQPMQQRPLPSLSNPNQIPTNS